MSTINGVPSSTLAPQDLTVNGEVIAPTAPARPDSEITVALEAQRKDYGHSPSPKDQK